MTQTYDSRTIHMHWASALLVVALWLVAQSIDFLPRGTPRMAARSIHITLGVLLAVLLAARVAWRLRSGTKLPRPDAGVLGRLAVSGHREA